MQFHPRFISFEGVDGSGKTTQVEKLHNYLTALFPNASVLQTKDPGGNKKSEGIRNIIKYKKGLSPEETLKLIIEAREINLAEVVLPALEKGSWVISDRFLDGSFCYQTLQGVHYETVQNLTESKTPHAPNLTILLDIDPILSLNRAHLRNKMPNRTAPSRRDVFERKPVEFHQSVRENFLKRAEKEPERIKVIEVGNKKPDEVFEAVKCVVGEYLQSERYLSGIEKADALLLQNESPDRSR